MKKFLYRYKWERVGWLNKNGFYCEPCSSGLDMWENGALLIDYQDADGVMCDKCGLLLRDTSSYAMEQQKGDDYNWDHQKFRGIADVFEITDKGEMIKL